MACTPGVWQRLALFLGLMAAGQLESAAATLHLPFDPGAVLAAPHVGTGATTRAPFSCPALIPPPRSLGHAPKFRAGDASASTVDPDRLAREESATAGLRAFNRIVASSADRALADRSTHDAAGRCVLAHLQHWAEGDALAGANSMQGDFERKWGSITWSLAYAENRDVGSPAQVAVIERWLRAAGQAVRDDYSSPTGSTPLPKTENNHGYWAALSVAAVGLALDDRSLFDWAMVRLPMALRAIGPDGSLPLELKRGSRALEYHRFALEPLLMLTLMARANGVALPADREEALKRLVALVRRGNEDPQLFQTMTGQAQQALDATPRNIWVWAELALALFPDPGLDTQVAPHRPLARTWLGGDLTLRYRPAR